MALRYDPGRMPSTCRSSAAWVTVSAIRLNQRVSTWRVSAVSHPPDMGLLLTLWTDWFLSVICLAIAALVPILYAFLRHTSRSPVFLNPAIFKELPLIDKKVLSYNTRLFRYASAAWRGVQTVTIDNATNLS